MALPSPDCDVVIIVRAVSDRVAVLNALTEHGERSVESEIKIKDAKLAFFRNHDGRRIAVTVAASKDPRARMDRMRDVATRTRCSCVALIQPGYTAQDLQMRRQIPDGCVPMFVEDTNMLLEILGYTQNINPLGREILNPLFPREVPSARPVPPLSPIRVEAESDDDLEGMLQSLLIPEPGSMPPRVTPNRGGGPSTIRVGPGSTVFSNVSMDAATFRSIMDAAPRYRGNVSAVIDMPATREEEEILNRPRSQPPSRRRLGSGGSIMTNDLVPPGPFRRAVPSAATVRLSPPPDYGVEDDEEHGYQPLVPFPRNPPTVPVINDIDGPDEYDRIMRAQDGYTGAVPPSMSARDFESAIRLARQLDAQATDMEALERAAEPVADVRAGRPMTAQERRRVSRRRVEEQGQQSAVVRVVKKTKKNPAMAPREEAPNITAMCVPAKYNRCTICLDGHITTAVLPCMHMLFCYACISKWVEVHHNCPACKTGVEATIQPRTLFDAPEEHKRRKLDPEDKDRDKNARANRKEVADALRKEAQDLEDGVESE